MKSLTDATKFLGFSIVSPTAAGGVAQTETSVKTVILVHGAWADGSSWSKLIPLLKSKGLTVVAVQLPLTSLEANAAVTKRAIDDADGPVLLVAHSWVAMSSQKLEWIPRSSVLSISRPELPTSVNRSPT
jgi:pimeloyl-ACP methyl ester carboxylesterase